MKTRLMIAIVLLMILAAAPVAAQGQYQDRLRDEIGKTDEIIERAREAVTESGSERARNQLVMAVRLQRMARELLQQPTWEIDETRALQIGKYTVSARRKAQQAVAITRQAEENEDYVRRRMEQTDQLILRLREGIGDDVPPGIRVLLDTAEDQQQRAEELFRNRRLRAALQLTMQVEKSLRETLQQQGGHKRAERRYRNQAERFLSLREQIQLSGPDDRPDIQNALRNAEQLRLQADNLAAENRYEQAEKTMMRAMESLTRAAEKIREPAKIAAALRHLTEQAEQIRARIREQNDTPLQARYENAHRHLEKAAEMYQQGNYETAAAQLQAARQVLHGIMKALGE